MRPLRARRGQSLTEMVIIVALIAIATIGVAGLFGDNLRALFGGSADSLAGNAQADNTGTAVDGSSLHKDMKTFGNNSQVGGGGNSGNLGDL